MLNIYFALKKRRAVSRSVDSRINDFVEDDFFASCQPPRFLLRAYFIVRVEREPAVLFGADDGEERRFVGELFGNLHSGYFLSCR